MFDLLPPLDVGDSKSFLAAAITMFAEYPIEVMDKGVFEIPQLSDRPTLKLMRQTLDKIYEPIGRELERKRAAESHQLGLAAPAKPDQDRRDQQVIDYKTRVMPVVTSALKTIPAARVDRGNDGRHFQRIAAELEARKARNNIAESTDPPNQNPPA